MKKIININFHGRVIPIEESAYEILQQYIESLRRHFANEEGRDEIVNDIENRFAELFSESLKKGATCITDADVNTNIASMGRPEDFEQEDMASASSTRPGSSTTTGATAGPSATTGTGAGQQSSASQQSSYQFTGENFHRLYRSENDKILGGVCAGLSNYLRIDPSIIRILFVLLTFGGGLGIILYIILWIVLPPKSLVTTIRKRLYRNSEDRIFGGVASGLAAYFHAETWIFRLVFAFPLLLGILVSILRSAWWWDFHFHPGTFIFGGLGGTLTLTYFILWVVLPEAVTAPEKLEMRGEKVDLESIKNTVRSDLSGFKERAEKMGHEMKENFQKAGEQMKRSTRNFRSEVPPAARYAGHGLIHAIGTIFKIFFLAIAGIMAFALIMVLIALIFSGQGIMSFKGFLLNGFWENIFIWLSFGLLLVIPVIALLTWLIRRIVGVRSRRSFLGYAFTSLWVIGILCGLVLVGMILNNFRYRSHTEEEFKIAAPTHGKLLIRTTASRRDYDYNTWWFDVDWQHGSPFYLLNDDTLGLNTVRVELVKSPDSAWHAELFRFSHGNDPALAKDLAARIRYSPVQSDSILTLPDGFGISREDKFRNQQVLVVVSIPVGKRIFIDRNIETFRWFDIDINRHHFYVHNNRSRDDYYSDTYNDWGPSYDWSTNREYIMTETGLSATDQDSNLQPGLIPSQPEIDRPGKAPATDSGYRYHGHTEKSTTMATDPEHRTSLLSIMFNS